MADYPLGSLGIQIREHWKKYRPQMYAELRESGHLQESVYEAQEQSTRNFEANLTAPTAPTAG